MELWFDSVVIEKDVCCEKKAKKQALKGKMQNHSPYPRTILNTPGRA